MIEDVYNALIKDRNTQVPIEKIKAHRLVKVVIEGRNDRPDN